ncbi:gamma-glutamylcyclotransferase [Streptomyces sp. NPDC005791]|uniref:gamma-glutamylcyclotransferase n=1 Tax=Streptomyces sp. NPDC005791 TaxID=3364732 RepID=UPI0036756B25
MRDALLHEAPATRTRSTATAPSGAPWSPPRPGRNAELLGLLDDLEQHLGPHHPRNPYERVARRAVPGPLPDTPGGASGEPGPAEPVRAWVHLAATAVPRSPRTGGTPVPGGDRLSRRPPPARRTP